MARVEACPKNLTKVIEASKRLGCKNDKYGNNQYICLPNVDNTSLVEFCYGGIMGFQKKGIFYILISGSDTLTKLIFNKWSITPGKGDPVVV